MPQNHETDTQGMIATASVEKGARTLLDFTISRDDRIEVTFRVASEIEHFFMLTSERSKNTSKWVDQGGNHPDYYLWKGNGSDALADAFMAAHLNAYGGKLFDGERVNVSILRTVGASDGITLVFDDMMSKETLEEIARQMQDFVRKLYKQFIRRVVVRTSITTEELI